MAVYNNNISFNDEVTNNIYVNSEDLSIGNCPQIFIDNPDILKYIIESMITVRGEITRPGVYFFNSNDRNVPLKDLLLYAGYKGGNVIVSPDRKNINIESKNIELKGSVRFPQKLNFINEPKLSEIFPNANYVLPETYPLFAVIKRRENKIGTLSFITFNPEAIYSGLTDIKLMNGDVIQFFSKDEIQDILDSSNKKF